MTPNKIDTLIRKITFNEQGLIPAIAQEEGTNIVLMMAWMNEAAIRETLTTRRVCYWSRSRNQLWRKGETSGHIQQLISFALDCDYDAILLTIQQTGPACHTGKHICFFNKID